MPAKPLETHGQGIQTQVGGDWYDIIPLSAGRVGIVIGDVEGRGARAAAIMGQLRAALRAFAQDDKPPAEILRKLDEWCRTLGPAEADAPAIPARRTRRWSAAPTSSTTRGPARCRSPTPATTRRCSSWTARSASWRWSTRACCSACAARASPGCRPTARRRGSCRAGSTLVLYTDGLTDRRHRADGTGHYTEDEARQMLRQAVRPVAHGDVEHIAQAAEDAVPGDIDDDMAIVAIRTSPVDLASWEGTFPAEPIMVSEARRLAEATFRPWGMEREQADLTCLLVSEVVTNVVLHRRARGRPAGRLALEVGRRPRPASAGPGRRAGSLPRSSDDGHGRGGQDVHPAAAARR